MQGENNNTSGRELRISGFYNAPVDFVWKAWSPEYIAEWWGPDGFTTTINKMDMVPGGEWELILHGPDGTDYYNRSVFKEIVKHKKIVFDHISGPKFTATVEFEEQDGKTLIHWHSLFETIEQFIQVVRIYKADEGLKQNVEKLRSFVENNKPFN